MATLYIRDVPGTVIIMDSSTMVEALAGRQAEAELIDALQGSIHAPHPLHTCDAELDDGGHHADVQVFPRS